MDSVTKFEAAFAECPMVAILRGVRPDEVEEIGGVLIDAGFTLIEVPMNSPEPLESIRRLARAHAGRAVFGAGTVLDVATVDAVRDAGGEMVISPNVDTAVITATVRNAMVSLPGFATPSDAFRALAAGAHALKLFPAEASSPAVLKAMRAVLPADRPVLIVGGIAPGSMSPWIEAGASGFGLGSALFKPGFGPQEVGNRARAFVATFRDLRTGITAAGARRTYP